MQIRKRWTMVLILGVFLIGCGGGSGGKNSSFDTSGNSPRVESKEKIFTVKENSLFVGKIEAQDNSKLSYYIDGEDEKYFHVNSYSGRISFLNKPNYNTKSQYSIIGLARDIVGNETNQSIIVKIQKIENIGKDITPPIFKSKTDFQLNKLTALINPIRILSTDNSTVTYTLTGEGSDDFQFDSYTGILRAIDLEKSLYHFTIKATDNAKNSSTQVINISIIQNNESENNTNNKEPIFLSSNTISVQLSTQVDYYTAPSILTIQSESRTLLPISYFIQGNDRNSFDVIGDELYFSQSAIPLIKRFYTITIVASDGYNNQTTQDVTIHINDDLNHSSIQFLSSNNISVPFSEQSHYYTSPSIFVFETDKNAKFSIEGIDSNNFYLYLDNNKILGTKGWVYFKKEAYSLKKSSYSFILVATNSMGDSFRQTITLTISDYEDLSNVITPIPSTPLNLLASDVDYPNKIVINWDPVNEADHYKLYMSNEQIVTSNSAHTNFGNETSYEYAYDGQGYNSEGYAITYFSVVACNANDGCSDLSQTVKGSIKKEFSEYVDISGYWANESESELRHYNDDGTEMRLLIDENNCYTDYSLTITRNDFNTITENGLYGVTTYDVKREDALLIIEPNNNDSYALHRISSQPFYDTRVGCE